MLNPGLFRQARFFYAGTKLKKMILQAVGWFSVVGFVPQQGYKPEVAMLPGDKTSIGLLFNSGHYLVVVFINGNYQNSAWFELFHEWFWYKRSSGGNDNFIKRGKSRKAFVAIAEKCLYQITSFGQHFFGFGVKCPLPLNGKNLGTHLVQYTCLISRAGADFQNLVAFFYLQKLRLKSNRIWLRNGLACTNGERLVFVSKLQKAAVEEPVPRNSFHSFENILISNTFLPDGFCQFFT